jgi:hypothetical protein
MHGQNRNPLIVAQTTKSVEKVTSGLDGSNGLNGKGNPSSPARVLSCLRAADRKQKPDGIVHFRNNGPIGPGMFDGLGGNVVGQLRSEPSRKRPTQTGRGFFDKQRAVSLGVLLRRDLRAAARWVDTMSGSMTVVITWAHRKRTHLVHIIETLRLSYSFHLLKSFFPHPPRSEGQKAEATRDRTLTVDDRFIVVAKFGRSRRSSLSTDRIRKKQQVARRKIERRANMQVALRLRPNGIVVSTSDSLYAFACAPISWNET